MPDIVGDDTESPIDSQSPPAMQPADSLEEAQPPDWFDEEAYLRANPDVSDSIALGEFRSAFDHFTLHGRDENRLLRPNADASDEPPQSDLPSEPPHDLPSGPPLQSPDWFDQDAYLLANPDVAVSLANGEFRSPFDHFALHGRHEQRPLRPRIVEPLVALPQIGPPADPPAPAPKTQLAVQAALEAIVLSACGGLFLVGWVDDLSSPMEWITVSGPGWSQTLSEPNFTRVRRTDVEAALGVGRMHRFGYFAYTYTAEPFDTGAGDCQIVVHLCNGLELEFSLHPRRVSDIELRDIALTYVPGAEVFGNREVEANRMLSGALKATILRHNRHINRELVKGAYAERFGPRPGSLRGSMVVCLYGKPQYLFLQSALFSGRAGFEDYEMIYVSNSPEMAEQLMKDARACAIVYGLPQTVVLLPGNAGFGAANNLAVNHASSDRILIVNPDVFPYDEDWARKHTQIVADLPREQTQLFGAPLYYDDGSLMHGGMYFEYDMGLSADENQMTSRRLVRIEHYGKGAPAFSNRYTRSRPVPAVTGAFVSAARGWFEKLGGFTEDFVFGHYEDADLCLKSLSAGVAPWIHDLRLWHMEGKGSTRLAVHEGGSHVNRSLFSERWEAFIDTGLEGPNPNHPLLRESV
jgi:hypothetical protein